MPIPIMNSEPSATANVGVVAKSSEPANASAKAATITTFSR